MMECRIGNDRSNRYLSRANLREGQGAVVVHRQRVAAGAIAENETASGPVGRRHRVVRPLNTALDGKRLQLQVGGVADIHVAPDAVQVEALADFSSAIRYGPDCGAVMSACSVVGVPLALPPGNHIGRRTQTRDGERGAIGDGTAV